jgi:hypothetical protein
MEGFSKKALLPYPLNQVKIALQRATFLKFFYFYHLFSKTDGNIAVFTGDIQRIVRVLRD